MTDNPTRKNRERDGRRVQADVVLVGNILAVLDRRGKSKGWLGMELVKFGGLSTYGLIYEKFEAIRLKHLGTLTAWQAYLISDILEVPLEDLHQSKYRNSVPFGELEEFE